MTRSKRTHLHSAPLRHPPQVTSYVAALPAADFAGAPARAYTPRHVAADCVNLRRTLLASTCLLLLVSPAAAVALAGDRRHPVQIPQRARRLPQPAAPSRVHLTAPVPRSRGHVPISAPKLVAAQVLDTVVLPAPFTTVTERVRALRTTWQPAVQTLTQHPAFAADYAEVADLLAHGTLLRAGGGVGGVYFLQDAQEQTRWVIKPVDEEARGPNNPTDCYDGPDVVSMRYRPAVPLLTPMQRELASDAVAEAWGLKSLRPTTLPVLVDFAGRDHVSRYVKDTEKLCSAQRFVANTMPFAEMVQMHLQHLPRTQQDKMFDRQEYEETTLLNWGIYDNDAHLRNVLVYVKAAPDMSVQHWLQLDIEARQALPLGFMKIDNGLAMPESNGHLRNDLAALPYAEQPLSGEVRQRMLARLTDERVQDTAMRIEKLALNLDAPSLAGRAYEARMYALRIWLQDTPNITLAQIHSKFVKAEKQL